MASACVQARRTRWEGGIRSLARPIEDELETTLDYKLRSDGTATVWCGMSGHDFHHEPTPKELLEGLADAYRREAMRLEHRIA